MHEFTDGCSSQYKSRNCMGDVSRIHGELGYSKIIRNFYETSHEKGPQDATGGFVKHQADMAVLMGSEMIQNAKDFFDFVDNKLEYHSQEFTSDEYFDMLKRFNETKFPTTSQ